MNIHKEISFKEINKLAIPALIAGVAEPLLSITDLAIIGNMKDFSTESTAAIGIVGGFLSMLIWVFGQSRSAISSIISQYLGANKLEEVKKLPIQAIAIILSLSLIIIVCTYPFARPIFEFYNASGQILDFSILYYKIRVYGFPFTLFIIIGFGIFRGLQNTKFTMLIALVGTLLNIGLDFILIYGVENYVPALGIEGAAYASVISQIIMALMTLVLLLKKTSISFRLSFPFHHEINKFVIMTLNLFVRTIALNIALYFATSFATSYGDNYIAAYTIGFNLWLTGAFIIDGYTSAGTILSGKLLGKKDFKTLHILCKKLLKYGIILGLILTCVGFIFYKQIGLVFTKEKEVLSVFYDSFWIILIMQPFCAITFIYDGLFKGMGKTHILRNVLLASTLLFFVPTIHILDYLKYTVEGIWFAFFIWIIARSTPLIVLFKNIKA